MSRNGEPAEQKTCACKNGPGATEESAEPYPERTSAPHDRDPGNEEQECIDQQDCIDVQRTIDVYLCENACQAEADGDQECERDDKSRRPDDRSGRCVVWKCR